MLPGVYIVSFSAGSRTGQGLAVLNGQKINGGDASYLYRGQYTETNGKAQATLEIKSHTAGANSVFGNYPVLHLTLTGASNPMGFTMTGATKEVANMTITITGKKIGDLA